MKTKNDFVCLSLWITAVLVFCFALSRGVFGATTLAEVLTSKSSRVEFLAIGHPSFLKVRGKCSEAAYRRTGDTLTAMVNLNSCDTGIDLRTKHMKEKYLQTDKFPQAILHGTITGKKFEGELAIHGKTSHVTGTLEDGATLNIKTKISNHDIPPPGYAGITLADEVQITADLK